MRQQINIASLDVDAFADQVGDPTDAEVSQLFAQYARKFPNEEEPGAPGFRLPFRAKLAYLELDSEQVEAALPEVTDEEIQKYYDENKETPLIRTPVLPDTEEEDEEKKDAASPESSEAKEDAKKEEAKDTESAEKEEPAKEEASKEEKPTAEKENKPAPKPDEAKEAPSKSEESQEPPAKDAAEEAEAGESKDEAPTETNIFTPDEKPEADSSAAEAKAPPAKPAPEKAEADDAPAGENSEDEKKDSPPPLIVPAAPTEEEKKTSEETPEIQYEYRKLDDELKQEIRDTIQRERTEERIDEMLTKAASFMKSLERERGREHFSKIEADPDKFDVRSEGYQAALKELRESLLPLNEDIAKRLKEYGNKNGLAYVETPMMSYAEFLDSEDYAVGIAAEPNENPMAAANSANVALTIFQGFSNDEQNNDGQLFQPRRAELKAAALDGGTSHYVYWATDFSTSHIPTLDEPGVRDMVVKAWKRLEAREVVTKRGEELAETIRKGLEAEGDDRKDMATTLKDQTVTGSDDSATIAVRKSLPFSWLRTSSASPMSFQRQQASQSPITFDDTIGGQLDRVGGDFMKAIFDEMTDESVKVVPNFDHSVYLIVHVTNRFPTPEIGEDSLRDRFATEGQQFAFAQSPMLGVIQEEIAAPARVAWERSVWIKYGVDPDSEPDE